MIYPAIHRFFLTLKRKTPAYNKTKKNCLFAFPSKALVCVYIYVYM